MGGHASRQRVDKMGKMKSFSVGLLFFLVSSATSARNPSMFPTIDIGQEKDITEVNEGDDIMEAPERQRSSITDYDLLWESPVAYALDSSLDLNAKGVILRAIDQFRLKTCVDFTPRKDQDYFLNIQKLGGCFSYIGQLFWTGGQPLSIGQYCDEISTVEHEFLHAFGFYHEQSRPDRNNFVTIAYENILEGRESQFRMVNESSTQGVPYDYLSVMHYGKTAFGNGNGSTIITKDPDFQDRIGQRQAMSPSDILEFNILYECTETVAFQLFCDFSDADLCGMRHCSQGNITWERVMAAEGGPTSDHTSLPNVTEEGDVTPEPPTEGYFMHVSTAVGEAGDAAWLESPRVKPRKAGHLQCLQFYYYHNGSADDQLNIWIREFKDENDTVGTVHIKSQVTGQPTSHWRLHHVPLDPKSEFQLDFEVRKGAGMSSGGISIDDINLSELQCPHVTIQIDEFEKVMTTSSYNTYVYSPRHYTSDGYAYRFAVQMNTFYFGLRFQLLSGQYDDELTWPCLNRQVTLMGVDQTPLTVLHMSKQRSFTTTADLVTENGTSYWDNPRKFDTTFVIDGETVFGGPLVGISFFSYLSDYKFYNFLKGGSAVFAFDFQDIRPLINGSTLPTPKLDMPNISIHPSNPRQGTCSTPLPTTPQPMTDKSTPPTINPRTGRTEHTMQPTTDCMTPHIPKTTDDRSIFGFSPVMASSPILILLTTLLLWLA